jgi:hypothetical protein
VHNGRPCYIVAQSGHSWQSFVEGRPTNTHHPTNSLGGAHRKTRHIVGNHHSPDGPTGLIGHRNILVRIAAKVCLDAPVQDRFGGLPGSVAF